MAVSTSPPIHTDPRRRARSLYWQGWPVSAIADELELSPNTIQAWKRRDNWDDFAPIDRVDESLDAKIQQILSKEKLDAHDLKVLDALGRQMERIARVRRYEETGNEADLNPNIESRNAKTRAGTRKKPTKNEFSPEQVERLHEAFMDWMFSYQRAWYEAGQKHRIRNLLKARRIGGTRYFAREALDDALQTGRSQIWLSASKAQAHEAKGAIVDFARSAADIELRGDPIVIPSRCTLAQPDEDPRLYFLGTNAMTAQGYGGNFIFDEYFWVHKFGILRKVASGMALHKRFRQTYLSSPSALSHEAYPFWSGSHFNRGRPKEQHIKLDVSHAALAAGRLCEDGQWRQIVTVEDAVTAGCNLYDLDQLRLEYSAEEFAQLLMCMFIDDGQSVFSFSALHACMVDAWEVWDDFKPFANRPLGGRGVWVGYDPSNTGDSAALVVVAPPVIIGGKFRVLEKMQFRGFGYEEQAEAIRKISERYEVDFIGIDTTGIGSAVYQLVKKWYPRVVAYQYSVELKTRMVLKAISVISKGRMEFDAGWIDVVSSFLSIKKTMTKSNRQSTFESGRSEETSHADLAWAIMHCLANEPLEGGAITSTNKGFVEFG